MRLRRLDRECDFSGHSLFLLPAFYAADEFRYASLLPPMPASTSHVVHPNGRAEIIAEVKLRSIPL